MTPLDKFGKVCAGLILAGLFLLMIAPYLPNGKARMKSVEGGNLWIFSEQSYEYEVETITIYLSNDTMVEYSKEDWQRIIVEVSK